MSWKVALAVAVGLVAAVVVARLRQDPETGTATWDAERAAGFAAYLLLWVSVVSGMSLFLRIRPGGAPLTGVIELHRITAATSLSFVAAHVVALLVDPVVTFAPLDAVVPFASGYRPIQTGLGTIAMELSVLVLTSTALAAWLGHRAWRTLHYLTLPCWLLALVHGITAGSDGTGTVAMGIYALSVGAVAALAALRMYGRGWAAPPRVVSEQR